MKIPGTLKKSILFGAVTVSCLVAGITLYSMDPVKKTAAREETPRKKVTVQPVRPGTYAPVVKAFGEAAPRWTTTLRTQVTGRITRINEKLQPGERFKAGETLLEINNKTYLSAVAQAKLDLENANVSYLKAVRKASQAKSDWHRSGFKGTPASPLVFHQPQVAAAKARVAAAQKALDNARQDLDNTIVTSPYAGLVVERFANRGETLFSGDPVAKIVSADEIEIKVNLDGAQVSAIGKWQEAEVRITEPVTRKSWPGKIIRSAGILDNKTRLQRFYIVPLKEREQILPGMFLTVSISGTPVENLLALPESALTRDGYVWFADDHDTLRNIKADALFYDRGKVFIKNTEQHDRLRVLVTPVQHYISGTRINPVTDGEN